MRSISGIRYKDKKKLSEMAERVLADPVFESSILDGAFRPWIEFACGIDFVREGKPLPVSLLRPGAAQAELAAFRLKSKSLQTLESQEALIKFAQHPIGEKILGSFVGTK